ncbi:HAD family hydrolase [Flavobacterium album]|uniref:HAD family hydrolase n=1 Tax=Flavobacterium album TaxID=2175091 RepID=A0A2S1QY47_9FLAO|nr:HAD family hydrolase [Flavobacterium album]AWH85336.1 HAD family hydrolase [Flavobacterium album]
MPIKAIIYDLDNTIYPVSAIGDKLFAPVFDLIVESGEHDDDFDAIRKAIMKTPFRLVAKKYNFSDTLTEKGIAVQEDIVYHDSIDTFEDYPEIKSIPARRYLVTTGFSKMQHSKIKQMDIAGDFEEIHVVNPTKTSKKEVFADILSRHSYRPAEVLVVGDDPESEIAAAKALGIPTVLYNKQESRSKEEADHTISHFKDLKPIFESY